MTLTAFAPERCWAPSTVTAPFLVEVDHLPAGASPAGVALEVVAEERAGAAGLSGAGGRRRRSMPPVRQACERATQLAKTDTIMACRIEAPV